MTSTPLFAAGMSSIALVTGVLASGLASAQSGDAPTPRADVKAETRAAAKANRLTPAGEGAAPTPATTAKSTKTRAQRKGETLASAKAGELQPAGDAGLWKTQRAETSTKSTKTRAQRKAEILQAAKDHSSTPAGEGSTAPSKYPTKPLPPARAQRNFFTARHDCFSSGVTTGGSVPGTDGSARPPRRLRRWRHPPA